MSIWPSWYWPTMCRTCHRWQGAVLCGTCLAPEILTRPRCRRCAIGLPENRSPREDDLCPLCEDAPPSFDHAVAALDYEAPWRDLVSSLKFKQDPAMAQTLGALLVAQLLARWGLRSHPTTSPSAHTRTPLRRLRAGAPSLVVPVPLSAQRMQERGYNQAALLAQYVSGALRLPLQHDLLRRTRHTSRLMSLDADERRQHIRRAFAVQPHHRPLLKNRHVAVVDDVLTTGATLSEVAHTLWAAGAREVSVWVVARTPASPKLNA